MYFYEVKIHLIAMLLELKGSGIQGYLSILLGQFFPLHTINLPHLKVSQILNTY